MLKTKLILEVEVTTQFGPNSAISLIHNLLTPYPAVDAVTVTKLETEWQPNLEFPLDVNLAAIREIPKKLK
jgi:hypothetical protein